ncbi:hypothetical protein ACH5RR_021743 [Cinchona calisaya]|uniref:DUF4283 domain-containing protein n=1 Tax=Cinchona calisaya TaxID=153742 RepID=A0ABD2ZJ52_9GENT
MSVSSASLIMATSIPISLFQQLDSGQLQPQFLVGGSTSRQNQLGNSWAEVVKKKDTMPDGLDLSFIPATDGDYVTLDASGVTEVYIFQFETEEAKIHVLENLPWPFQSKMLYLKTWTPEMDMSKDELTFVPIWVKFPKLKLHYYTARTLSKSVSRIGVPLYTDHMAADQIQDQETRVESPTPVVIFVGFEVLTGPMKWTSL